MFTGIIKGLGKITDQQPQDGDVRLSIDWQATEPGPVAMGDSIAVSGVCLTAAAFHDTGFLADVSRETLDLTTLGSLTVGSTVNLEGALRAGEPLGGHMVAGHVDGVGKLESMQEDARSWRLVFSFPPALARYIAIKGSIAVDGISLTVNEVDDATFGVNIVPHTMQHTTLGRCRSGDAVNLEIDMVARYLARLSAYDGA